MTFAPGFIDIDSKSWGPGLASVATAHITFISPTRERNRTDQAQCTLFLLGGQEIVVFMTRNQVLQAIAEADGAVPVGTGALIQSISATVTRDTQSLIAAIGNATPNTE